MVMLWNRAASFIAVSHLLPVVVELYVNAAVEYLPPPRQPGCYNSTGSPITIPTPVVTIRHKLFEPGFGAKITISYSTLNFLHRANIWRN